MIEIPLTQGYVAMVDDEDAYLLDKKWHVAKCPNNLCYARRSIVMKDRTTSEFMHRVIMEHVVGKIDEGKYIDHKDKNGLNNCRSNLRICTPQENQRNKKVNIRSRSGLKGVLYNSHNKKSPWRVEIKVDGKSIYIGMFRRAIDAHEAYCRAAREYFGEFWSAG